MSSPPRAEALGHELLHADAQALLALAEQLGVECRPNLDRGELLALLLQHHVDSDRRIDLGGVLELLPEGFGFLRFPSHDFEPGAADVYVSPSQVRALNLKSGHRISGPIRGPKGNERFFALVHVDRAEDQDPERLRRQVAFAARTPVLPKQPLQLPDARTDWRLLMKLAPWQHGQRVLVQAPAAWPRAMFLARLAAGVAAAQPTAQVQLCLLDQAPEAIAGARAAAGDAVQTIATTFDRGAERHLAMVELALAQACRTVETGRDVVLLVDSLTALARAAQAANSPTGRWLCPGLDVQAMALPKRLFAAARACAEGGSLTVIATALTGSDSVVDATVLGEFRHRANSDVVIDPALAAAGIEPAFDLAALRTRPEDDARSPAQRAAAEQDRQRLLAIAPAVRGQSE